MRKAKKVHDFLEKGRKSMLIEQVIYILIGFIMNFIIEKKIPHNVPLWRKFATIFGFFVCVFILSVLLEFFKMPLRAFPTLPQGVIVIFLLVILFILKYEKISYNEKEMSAEVRKFTNNILENTTTFLFSGNMDFWGAKVKSHSKSDEECTGQYMDDSEEYNQLLATQKEVGAKIKMLCKFDKEGSENLLSRCIDSTNRMEFISRSYGTMEENHRNQILRIGKMKHDLGSNIELRFYPSTEEGYFRARCIKDNHNQFKIMLYTPEIKQKGRQWRIGAILPVFGAKKEEKIYSYEIINTQEHGKGHYISLINGKWESAATRQDEDIVEICRLFYKYHTRKRVALLYAEAYEVSRLQSNARKEFPPFGVLYLAAQIKKSEGWEVDVLPVSIPTGDKREHPINLDSYDAVGFSITSTYAFYVFKQYLARQEEDCFKDKFIFAGGYYAEIEHQKVFNDLRATVILRGEGEESVCDLLEWHGNRRQKGGLPLNVYIKNGAKIEAKGPPAIIDDLNKLPFPERSCLPSEDVYMSNRLPDSNCTMVHMLFSRGCSYKCAYCAAGQDGRNSTVRYRSANNILEELRGLKSKIQGFSIIDDCFLTKRETALEICTAIKSVDLKWSLAARVDQIDDEILKALQSSGCREIKFGVETGSDELLERMKKGCTVRQAESALEQAKAYGFNVKIFLISGLPGENAETNEATKTFLRSAGKYIDRISLLRFAPLPGSAIYSNPELYGIKKESLSEINYSSMKLYHDTADWWSDSSILASNNNIYKDLYSTLSNKYFKKKFNK